MENYKGVNMPTFKRGRLKRYDPAKKKGQRPPPKPGVYRITSKRSGSIKYVGETSNLLASMRRHISSKKLKK